MNESARGNADVTHTRCGDEEISGDSVASVTPTPATAATDVVANSSYY